MKLEEQNTCKLSGLAENSVIHTVVEHNGEIILSDEFNNRVLIYNKEGELTQKIENLHYPRGLAAAGRYLYICEAYKNQILRFDLKKGSLEPFLKPGVKLVTPSALLAVDSKIFVADSGNGAIRIFDTTGIETGVLDRDEGQNELLEELLHLPVAPFSRQPVNTTSVQLQHPRCLTRDEASLWVIDSSDLYRISFSGELLRRQGLGRLAVYRGISLVKGVIFAINEADAGVYCLSAEKEWRQNSVPGACQGLGRSSEGNLLVVCEGALIELSVSINEGVGKDADGRVVHGDIQNAYDPEVAALITNESAAHNQLKAALTHHERLMKKVAGFIDELASSPLEYDLPGMERWRLRVFTPGQNIPLDNKLTGKSLETFNAAVSALRSMKGLFVWLIQNRFDPLPEIGPLLGKSLVFQKALGEEVQAFLDSWPSQDIDKLVAGHNRLSLRLVLFQQLESLIYYLRALWHLNSTAPVRERISRPGISDMEGTPDGPVTENYYQAWTDYFISRSDWLASTMRTETHVRAYIAALWKVADRHFSLAETCEPPPTLGFSLPILNYFKTLEDTGRLDELERLTRKVKENTGNEANWILPTQLPTRFLTHLEGEQSDAAKLTESLIKKGKLSPLRAAEFHLWRGEAGNALKQLEEHHPNHWLRFLCDRIINPQKTESGLPPLIYLVRGEFATALHEAETKHSAKGNPATLLDLIRCLFANQQDDAAVERTNELFEENRAQPGWFISIQQYANQSVSPVLKKHARAALKAASQESLAKLSGFLHVLFNLGCAEECLEHCTRLIQDFPNETLFLRLKGDFLLSLGRLEAASETIRTLIEKKPVSASLLHKLRMCCLAPELEQRGTELSAEISRIVPDDEHVHLYQAERHFYMNDFTAALELLAAVPKTLTIYPMILSAMCKALASLGRFRDLELFCLKHIPEYFGHFDLKVWQAVAWLETNQKDKLAYLHQMIGIPLIGSMGGIGMSGRLEHGLGRTTAGMRKLLLPLIINPSSFGARENALLIQAWHGSNSEDRRLTEVSTLLRNYWPGHSTTTAFSALGEEPAKAKEILTRLASNAKDNSFLPGLLLARIYLQHGNAENALQAVSGCQHYQARILAAEAFRLLGRTGEFDKALSELAEVGESGGELLRELRQTNDQNK